MQYARGDLLTARERLQRIRDRREALKLEEDRTLEHIEKLEEKVQQLVSEVGYDQWISAEGDADMQQDEPQSEAKAPGGGAKPPPAPPTPSRQRRGWGSPVGAVPSAATAAHLAPAAARA